MKSLKLKTPNEQIGVETYRKDKTKQIHNRITHNRKLLSQTNNLHLYCKTKQDTYDIMEDLELNNTVVKVITNKKNIIGLLIINRRNEDKVYKHNTMLQYLEKRSSGGCVTNIRELEESWTTTYEIILGHRHTTKETILGLIKIIREQYGFGENCRLTILCKSTNEKLLNVLSNCGFKAVGAEALTVNEQNCVNTIMSLPSFKIVKVAENGEESVYLYAEGL